MLNLKYLQENQDFVIERLKVKNFDASGIISELLEVDQNKRKVQHELETGQAEAKKIAAWILSLK